MSQRTVRAGVVGLTGIAARRQDTRGPRALSAPMPRSHVESYAALPDAELVAVCELKPQLIEDFQKTWSGSLPNVTAYSDIEQMLARERLDVLSVCTSDHAHHPIVLPAVEAGVPGIVCEKPLATTLADCDRMIEACNRAGTIVNVDHTRRWYPEYRAAMEAIEEGEIGTVRQITASFCTPRAMLARNGTHLVDCVRYFTGASPAWVFAELEEGFNDYRSFTGDGRDPDRDPACSGYIHFENGVRASVELNKQVRSGHYLLVRGDEGEIELQGGPGSAATLHRSPTEAVRLPVPAHRFSGVSACIDEVVQAVLAGKNGDGAAEQVSSPMAQARDVVEILIGFLRSHTEGNRRVDLPIKD